MIQGVGIDTVQIDRFSHWHTFSSAQLGRIFSIEEIAYCLEHVPLSAARFAVRFAAREAFFKAFQAAHPQFTFSFLTTCRAITITRSTNGLPIMHVDWQTITKGALATPPSSCKLSLSHSQTSAIAIVILS